METRTVKVSIKQARCWFNGNNKALKKTGINSIFRAGVNTLL